MCYTLPWESMARCYEAVPAACGTQRFGWHYSSDATHSIRPHSAVCAPRRVKDRHELLHDSPLFETFLENTCVGQVVLDRWSPLKDSLIPNVVRHGSECSKSSSRPTSSPLRHRGMPSPSADIARPRLACSCSSPQCLL